MARRFEVGSSEYYTLGSAGVTDVSLSLSCWYRRVSTWTDTQHFLFGIGVSAGNYASLNIQKGTGYELRATFVGSSTVTVDSAAATTQDAWEHGFATFTASAVNVWIDNADNGNGAGSGLSLSGIDDTIIGARPSDLGRTSDEEIAECAAWNVELDAAERAALAAGFSPLLIRPASLVFYAPLLETPRDLLSGGALTPNGTISEVAHPRVILPGRSIWVPPSAGGVAAQTSVVAAIQHTYNILTPVAVHDQSSALASPNFTFTLPTPVAVSSSAPQTSVMAALQHTYTLPTPVAVHDQTSDLASPNFTWNLPTPIAVHDQSSALASPNFTWNLPTPNASTLTAQASILAALQFTMNLPTPKAGTVGVISDVGYSTDELVRFKVGSAL